MSRPQFLVKHIYTGNGSVDEYTFDFKITLANQLLLVVVNDLIGEEIVRVRGGDTTYIDTLDFDPVDGKGTVKLKAPLPGSHRMALVLDDPSPVQKFEFRNKTSFTLRRFEDALDWLSGSIQSLFRRTKQSFRLNDLDDEDAFNPIFPPGVSDAAGRVLQVDEAGTGLKYGPLAKDIYGDDFGGLFSGFSSRFNEFVEVTGVAAAIRHIYNFTYSPPLVSLSASGSGTVRERGTTVTAVSLDANVTKRSDDMARIRFLKDGVQIADFNPPSVIGSGITSYNWTGLITNNSTFTTEVTDVGATGGPSTVSSSATFNFVYPYYYGVGAAALTAAQIVATLTKSIRVSSPTVDVTTSPAGQRYYFCYPASYPALTSIIDPNGFDTIADYTVRFDNLIGLDGTPQSYRIYEFNFPTTQTNFTNSYRR